VAYIYRHIRLDKNQPFYVGIGEDLSQHIGLYKRAYNVGSRSLFWKNITNKTEYRVDIILDDLTWEEACKKEKEFIALYGRKDLGKGTLVNLTDGGDGIIGQIFSSKSRQKMSISKIKQWENTTEEQKVKRNQKISNTSKNKPKPEGFGKKVSRPRKPMSEETKQKISSKKINHSCFNEDFAKKHYKPVIKQDKKGNVEEYESIKEASNKTGIKRTNISCCLIGKSKTAGSFKWFYKEKHSLTYL
jgi:hypothetical protein